MTTKNYRSRRVRRRIPNEEKEDRFAHLPNELILRIIETTKDAKTLTRCFAVSKRLASLARMTRSVTLSIHRSKLGVQCYNLTPDPLNRFQAAAEVSLHVIRGNKKTTKLRPFGLHWPRFPLNRHQNSEILAQLNNFDEIRNLSIRFTRGDVPFRCNDVMNWKLEMSLDYPLGFKSCVVLERESGSGLTNNRFRSEWVRKRVKWLAALIRLLLEMKPVLGRVMRDHPTVQVVTVGDLKGEIRGGEDLRGAKDTVFSEKTFLTMQTCFVPLIELSEPVRRAVEGPEPVRCVAEGAELEGPNQTASGVMVTVVRPFDIEKCDCSLDFDLVRSGLGEGGFGPEIAEKIASSQSADIMELGVMVNMEHTSEHN